MEPDSTEPAVTAVEGPRATLDEPHGRRTRARALVIAVSIVALGAGLGAGLSLAAGPSGAAGHVARLTSSIGSPGSGAAPGARITVSGTGVATGTPDELTLQMGASTTATTAAGALDRNDAEIASLTAVFTAAGVKPADIQTSGLGLQANYDSSGNVTGYQASDALTVTIGDLADAGTVIDAAAHAVGNDLQIEGISFSIANTAALLDAARARAVEAADAKASTFATAAGTTLGPVVSISDQEQQPSPIVEPSNFAEKAAAGAAVPVPVEAGSQQISVQVTVVYELTNGRS